MKIKLKLKINRIKMDCHAFARLFLNGSTMPIERLYPAVEFPVSRGTPMISPLIKWDHTEDWFVMKFTVKKGGHSGERKAILSLDADNYISGHIIDGKIRQFFLFISQNAKISPLFVFRSCYRSGHNVLAISLGNIVNDVIWHGQYECKR